MVKKFKATLKCWNGNTKQYQVIRIIGPEVNITMRGGKKVRVGAFLNEFDANMLGECAVLTITSAY